MSLIDLTHEIHENIPVYPGTEPPCLVRANSIEVDGFAEMRLSLHSHTGTHLDAPCHILPGAASLDQLPVDRFFGPGVRVDLRGLAGSVIAVEHLEPWRCRIEQAEFVLLHTGWDAWWGGENYFEGFPALSAEAGQWLAGFALKGVGIDAISIDPMDSPDLPAHRTLLGKNILIVENLTHLEKLETGVFHFACFALKIRGGDGSPVRAVALVGQG